MRKHIYLLAAIILIAGAVLVYAQAGAPANPPAGAGHQGQGNRWQQRAVE